MKIIYSDNIPTDISNETLWMENVEKSWGQRICDKLNENLGDHQGPFYRLVEDEKKLYKFEY